MLWTSFYYSNLTKWNNQLTLIHQNAERKCRKTFQVITDIVLWGRVNVSQLLKPWVTSKIKRWVTSKTNIFLPWDVNKGQFMSEVTIIKFIVKNSPIWPFWRCRRRKPLALKLLLDQGRSNEILIRASKYARIEWCLMLDARSLGISISDKDWIEKQTSNFCFFCHKLAFWCA